MSTDTKGFVRIKKSTIINAPIDKVWELVQSFNGLPNWTPVSASEIEDGKQDNVIGSVRRVDFTGLPVFRERLVSHDSVNHSYSFTIIECPFPFTHHMATLSFKEITEEKMTYFEYNEEVYVPSGEQSEFKEKLEEFCVLTMKSLKEKFLQPLQH